jgi:hypothetical protein
MDRRIAPVVIIAVLLLPFVMTQYSSSVFEADDLPAEGNRFPAVQSSGPPTIQPA